MSNAPAASTTSLNIASTDPAGYITLIQPPQSSTSFFKIAPSQSITFAWNFTYLKATPNHLTLHAIGENGNTYPVGPTDGVIAGAATSVVWDPHAWNQVAQNTPLAQQKYRLTIWGDYGPDAPAAPGLLSPNQALQFALYTPQPYTGLAQGWTCTNCHSGAVSALTGHPAFTGVMCSLLVVMITSWSLLRSACR